MFGVVKIREFLCVLHYNARQTFLAIMVDDLTARATLIESKFHKEFDKASGKFQPVGGYFLNKDPAINTLERDVCYMYTICIIFFFFFFLLSEK